MSCIPSLPSFCESDIRQETAAIIGLLMQNETSKTGRIAFETGGAQGMELALKIAMLNTGNRQVLVFDGAYHGRSAWMSQFSASQRYRSLTGDMRVPVTRLPFPAHTSGILNKETWREWYKERIDVLFQDDRYGLTLSGGKQDIAALVYEPVLNVAGLAMPDSDVLRHIVQKTRDAGGVIIADEIFTGCFRTGTFLASSIHDITPDIAVLSKGLTNGLTPLSVVWARNPLLEPELVPPGTHSTTYLNNILSLTTASVVLKRLADWRDRSEHLQGIESGLVAMIDHVRTNCESVLGGYAKGAVGRIVLKKPIAGEIRKSALENGKQGLILASTGMAPDILNIHPPLNFSIEDMATCNNLIHETLSRFAHEEIV